MSLQQKQKLIYAQYIQKEQIDNKDKEKIDKEEKGVNCKTWTNLWRKKRPCGSWS